MSSWTHFSSLVSDSWEQAKAKAEEYGERLAHEAAEVAEVAKVRAAEAKERAKEAYEDIRADLSREKDADASAGEITAVNLEAHGVSQELRTLAASLTQRTFLDFPLAELEGEAKRAWRLTPWQETHTLLITKVEPSLEECRFALCPRRIPESRFWRIYFTLAAPLLPDRLSTTQQSARPSLPPGGSTGGLPPKQAAAQPDAAAADVAFGGSHRRAGSEVESQSSFQLVSAASVHSLSTGLETSPTSNSQSNSDGKEVDFDTEIEGDGGGGGLKPDMELEQYLTSALASDSPGAVGVGGSESCAGSDSGGSGSEVDLSTFAQLGLNVDDDSESD